MSSGRPIGGASMHAARWRFCAVICLAWLASCVSYLPTVRYKLTVVVDTPQGRVSGSSVVDLQLYHNPNIPGAGLLGQSALGEATPVKLPDGRYVVALFRWNTLSPDDQLLPMLMASFQGQIPPRITSGGRDALKQSNRARVSALARAKGVGLVPLSYYPIIAVFSDPMNLESIKPIPADQLSKVVPGARVANVTVEITDAPVTDQLENIMPWLKADQEGFLYPPSRRILNNDIPSYELVQKNHFLMRRSL